MSETDDLKETIKRLEERIAALERVVDGLGELLRPQPKERNHRITRWMND
jgi:hypothetical protein